MKLSKLFYIFFTVITLTSCKDKKTAVEQTVQLEEDENHRWYYFENGIYKQTELPQNSPILSLKPWTESLRISDGNVTQDGKGILLVNHGGILLFEGNGEPRYIQDTQLFSEATAGNLIFEKGEPFFTLAKNSFFNKYAAGKDAAAKNHVIRFSFENSMFYPTVTYGDLKIEDNSEVSGTWFDGKNWFTSIKHTDSSRTEFRYIKWNAAGNLASLSPVTLAGKVSVAEISEETYRAVSAPLPFSKAPVRIKELLSSIPASFEFNLTCRHCEGGSPRYFYNGYGSDEYTETAANAIITPEWVCVVFGDGTSFFRGEVKGRPLMKNGKTVAFRLPKLPETYVYGDFVISGDYMAVAWEEKDFYKTGRTGFLVVNLAGIFYED